VSQVELLSPVHRFIMPSCSGTRGSLHTGGLLFNRVQHFLTVWQQESAQTARVLECITDESLSQPVAPGHRTLGELAWHLTTALQEIAGKTGLHFDGPGNAVAPPATAQALGGAYVCAARCLAEAMAKNWTDETLSECHEVYGMQWENGATLMVMLHHEIHHRGQMTVLMRQAGLKLPGVYGPSAAEPSEQSLRHQNEASKLHQTP